MNRERTYNVRRTLYVLHVNHIAREKLLYGFLSSFFSSSVILTVSLMESVLVIVYDS